MLLRPEVQESLADLRTVALTPEATKIAVKEFGEGFHANNTRIVLYYFLQAGDHDSRLRAANAALKTLIPILEAQKPSKFSGYDADNVSFILARAQELMDKGRVDDWNAN